MKINNCKITKKTLTLSEKNKYPKFYTHKPQKWKIQKKTHKK